MRRDLFYSICLFLAAIATATWCVLENGVLTAGQGWGAVAFFVVFSLFTIATGFPHPVFGHVSFDRIAQVMAILVLGPVDAAWVSAVASFIYPWHRLWLGVERRTVVMAALHNSGLMFFVVLGSGLLYQWFGGQLPLLILDPNALSLVIVLVIAMQLINDLGMMLILYLRNANPWLVFNRFTAVVEFVSGAGGVVLAVAYLAEAPLFFILTLLVFVAGMLVIMQYALMRYRLEKIVDERTEELRVQAEEFERQATHDPLTTLPNRRYADDFVSQQVSLVHRGGREGAVAMADVDHFKRINDEHSHGVGDNVLKQVARILKDGCRQSDFVARYGGEEFLLYFPDTDIAAATEVCEELRAAVENARWPDTGSLGQVTISFGVAEIGPNERRRTVLNDADTRLYRAKREGRNRVVAD